MGSSLKELVEDLAQAEKVKMVQVGGASGRVIPYHLLDTALAFEGVLGAGAIIVFDESRDVIDIVYRTMEFLAEESCGKCTPCREGTQVMLQILARFCQGQGAKQDIENLERIASVMALCSLCGLGQAAPNAVVDTLCHYRSDYESRVRD